MKRKQFIYSIMSLASIGSLKALHAISESLPEEEVKMPALFIGHGSPMNAIEDNLFSSRWREMGKEIPRPKAVLCISAHWLSSGTRITAMPQPRTIHDFGGFPQALFDVQYPAPGQPQLAAETQAIIKSTPVELDHDWGFDHGCWSVVKQMYPEADIPVLQLSIDYNKPADYHYALGRELSVLRKKGILILGSGNLIHNLRMIGFPKESPGDLNTEYGYDWAIEMNTLFRKHITEGNHKALIDYLRLGKSAQLAIPTPDHYYPAMYALAQQEQGEDIQLFNDRLVGGSISMLSMRIG